MELNREQIIKALECCTSETEFCTGCPFLEVGACKQSSLLKLALSLIKELTEDSEAKDETIANLIETITSIQADTVRKMQERVKKAICDNTYPDFDKEGKPVNVWKATTGYDAIDQIAKEMLEGGNE